MNPFDESLLTAYLDDELSPEDRRLVDERMAQDPALRKLMAELHEVRSLVKQLMAETPHRDLSQSVLEQIASPAIDSPSKPAEVSPQKALDHPVLSNEARTRNWQWSLLAVVAASLIVALFAPIWLSDRLISWRPAPSDRMAPSTSLESASGKEKTTMGRGQAELDSFDSDSGTESISFREAPGQADEFRHGDEDRSKPISEFDSLTTELLRIEPKIAANGSSAAADQPSMVESKSDHRGQADDRKDVSMPNDMKFNREIQGRARGGGGLGGASPPPSQTKSIAKPDRFPPEPAMDALLSDPASRDPVSSDPRLNNRRLAMDPPSGLPPSPESIDTKKQVETLELTQESRRHYWALQPDANASDKSFDAKGERHMRLNFGANWVAQAEDSDREELEKRLAEFGFQLLPETELFGNPTDAMERTEQKAAMGDADPSSKSKSSQLQEVSRQPAAPSKSSALADSNQSSADSLKEMELLESVEFEPGAMPPAETYFLLVPTERSSEIESMLGRYLQRNEGLGRSILLNRQSTELDVENPISSIDGQSAERPPTLESPPQPGEYEWVIIQIHPKN